MVQSTLFGLHELGMAKGDNVAIMGDNSLPWLCADLATLAGGLPNVVISPNVSDFTLSKILAHSRCRAIFMDALVARRLLAVKAQLPTLSHAMFLTTAPKSFAAVCHLPSCWSGADAVVSTNWINCWKQSSQII